ncbi:hypothetical protein C4565_05015 [Candidatus Parcubacteria bacterium]|nr:MAG: hypothetical protein C4565_05015 [Candidatus Parcubacteria bacterium]
MRNGYKTDGEHLVFYIDKKLLTNQVSSTLKTLLAFTGRADELAVFFNDVTVVNMAGRIVIAGNSIAKKYHMNSPEFNAIFKRFLLDSFLIPHSMFDEFYRFSIRAVKASQETIQDSLRRKIRNHARGRGERCYMCGVNLDFNINGVKTPQSKDDHYEFTCEHIWPREYGGNSVEYNLLPACKSCNSSKKKNFASWVMPSIQSLIHGLNPDQENLQMIAGSHKFAMHYRYAQQLANKRQLSLKEAFLKIGPWENVEVIRADDSADFFNLKNYQYNPQLFT